MQTLLFLIGLTLQIFHIYEHVSSVVIDDDKKIEIKVEVISSVFFVITIPSNYELYQFGGHLCAGKLRRWVVLN